MFRAVSLADNGDGSFTVTAVQHAPEKEAIVDKGAVFEPKPDTPASGFIPPVENLTVEITSDNEAWQAEAAWNSPYALRGMAYYLKLLMGERIAGTAMTKDSFYRFSGMPEGHYTLVVTPQNDRGQKGEPAVTEFSVNPPEAPSQIDVAPGYFSLSVVPRAAGRNSLRNQYEFWFSEAQINDHREIESAVSYLGNGSMWVIQGSNLKPDNGILFMSAVLILSENLILLRGAVYLKVMPETFSSRQAGIFSSRRNEIIGIK